MQPDSRQQHTHSCTYRIYTYAYQLAPAPLQRLLYIETHDKSEFEFESESESTSSVDISKNSLQYLDRMAKRKLPDLLALLGSFSSTFVSLVLNGLFGMMWHKVQATPLAYYATCCRCCCCWRC